MKKIDERKLYSLINNYEKDLIEFCRELVKTPSVNGVHNEKKIANLINIKAKKLGLASKLIALDKNRPNVFIGKDFKRRLGLLFVAHLDTVPVGDERQWKHQPFGAETEDGKIYGRGAIDCKAGIALSLYTLKILKGLGYEEVAKFAGVVDEESAPDSKIGARFLLDRGLNAETAIYTYPGVDTVTIGHRGVIRLWIEVEGEAAHSGSISWQNSEKGANAIDALSKFVISLEKINMRGTHKSFPGYRFKHTATLVEGGSGESIVPDKAKVLVDARILPNHDSNEYVEKMLKLAESFNTDKIRFNVKIKNNIPGATISSKEKIVRILKKLDKEVMDTTPKIKGSGPVSEGYMFINAGIPCVCGFGAEGFNYHSADEYLETGSLKKILEIYVRAAIELSLR